jgi:hypothetical protein
MPKHVTDVPIPPMIVNRGLWKHRLLIGTPMTGLLRAEWVDARYNQVIPTNWSQVEMKQFMYSHIPLRFQVADAENLIVKMVVEQGFEWLLFIEHDNVLPPNTFVRFNEYMVAGDIPMVSSLYFTKSDPPEPMVYKDFGWGHVKGFKLGDKVWCKGVPFGCTLIHSSLLKVLWNESPEYVISNTGYGSIVTRRVFQAQNEQWYDPEVGGYRTTAGTSDLQFCERLVKEKIFEKAGWPAYQKMEYPILVDTNIFVTHIDDRGVQFPITLPKWCEPDPPPQTSPLVPLNPSNPEAMPRPVSPIGEAPAKARRRR